jgi:hypothetical protein
MSIVSSSGPTSSSATSINFSAVDLDSICGVKITKLPDGAALGAGDLQRWAHNRLSGRSGVSLNIEQTAAGWMVSLPNGKTVGPFKERRDAWDWIKFRRRGR